MAEGSPTVRRRELGALLRRLREEKGLSVRQVTDHLMCSASKISRLETGERGATLRDVRDLCDLYGVSGDVERERLMRLAKEGKEPGWWQSYGLPFATYVDLETAAIRIKDYDSAVIPGLLQTADYVRALHYDPLPKPPTSEMTPSLVDQRVEARLKRQDVLRRPDPPPLELITILDEAVLHRPIGGPAVMRTQLLEVVKAIKSPNITVKVLPYSIGAHPGLDSTFNILQFAPPMHEVVYIEGLAGYMFMERPEDVERYETVFDRLVERSLSTEQSIDLILEVARSFENGLKTAS